MPTDSQGRTQTKVTSALITGAASGIGLALARHLAAQNVQVHLTDISLAAAEAAAANLAGMVQAHALDVSNEAQITQIADKIGAVDLLINNAGLQHVAPIEDFPSQRFRTLIDVLLTGPAMMTRAFLPGMYAQNYGRIINIGSIHALVASPYKSAYVAAKHGLIGFSKTIALEAAERNVTINTLCPAYVRTPLVEQQISAQAQSHGISEEAVINDIMLKPMPKKSFIGTDELCGAVDYLIGPAARNMTAQTLVLDGGWTAR
ncbi:3-hydroxybutyrate dehydrogenase [Simiduia agarivorans]|uniref:3-hydroxybutyrate dehydrogenase n=1 Tax=Simiduia agarivorans (strain DSM 21679 / JCM 13881 / BCRC 17597 / SA1) TaxID=1117647 RepID=K4KLY7_SIMAS|nr:3-hydroxybutyrate dehydrogenase [Simiduia agarivorans]AFV00165.1 3-hydroxybutyrate dehydrogenase [Simiduia agarivorans SA1 = DSM 21679]